MLQTPMSTSIYFVHRNPAIYPDPQKFDPERWIKATETGNPLHRYLVPFTKGSRICLGMNLAFLEMYLAIAYHIRRFDLEICDTDPESLRVTREKVLGFPEHGGLQIKARVKAVLKD
ncbi:cytochrome P450 [Aspergillus candidus]|uniref:Cytochrome P450 n=1 Tax=Aspergillus candidus TaxID=41067 RepID=A0A2I2EZC7_ASPCN|nr:cytochrome P450 [Aspergillus candidus]PLB33722.1 cytochrome P450 [Aspergillus candidus]